MRKTALLIGIFIVLFSFKTTAQTEFGAKAGINSSRYSGSLFLAKYQYKVGYYAGGFANMAISESFRLQTELLFAIQGSNYLVQDLTIRDSPYEIAKVGDFKTTTTEATILVPILAQYYIAEKVYFETGPQFGLILKQTEKVLESPTDDPDFNVTADYEDNTFDFGIAIGAGYEINENLSLNLRYFFGLVKRNLSDIKSTAINLGLEYEL